MTVAGENAGLFIYSGVKFDPLRDRKEQEIARSGFGLWDHILPRSRRVGPGEGLSAETVRQVLYRGEERKRSIKGLDVSFPRRCFHGILGDRIRQGGSMKIQVRKIVRSDDSGRQGKKSNSPYLGCLPPGFFIDFSPDKHPGKMSSGNRGTQREGPDDTE
jgi:hypothetical protein